VRKEKVQILASFVEEIGKLLLMMKTKGCEEKWDFVKSLCKMSAGVKNSGWN
jgi:hypothetical protein